MGSGGKLKGGNWGLNTGDDTPPKHACRHGPINTFMGIIILDLRLLFIVLLLE